MLKYLFFGLTVLSEVIRYPYRMRNKRDRRQRRVAESRIWGPELAVTTLGFIGTEVLPLVYVFSRRLRFADYRLPRPVSATAGAAGVATFLGGLWLLRRAHADLGTNWSPTLETYKEHSLVTGGVYAHVRHPIYSTLLLFGVGQLLMLRNWVAGLGGLVAFALVYFVRVPLEEKMMLDRFGDAYRAYAARTGGVVPRLSCFGAPATVEKNDIVNRVTTVPEGVVG